MGQFRLSIYSGWQIGLAMIITSDEIKILLPFISIHIGLTKYAAGVFIFGHYFG